MADRFEALKAEIRACRACAEALPHAPRPVVRGRGSARLRLIGQAPGTRVHASGAPFTDPSGDRLRAWLGLSEAAFYDEDRVAITPMGFCFPGLDARGADRPPRPECAPLWQGRCTAALDAVRLTLLIGAHAQRAYLPDARRLSMTETVLRWRNPQSGFVALPHPSWRNNRWLKQNPWFENEVLPELRLRIRNIMNGDV